MYPQRICFPYCGKVESTEAAANPAALGFFRSKPINYDGGQNTGG